MRNRFLRLTVVLSLAGCASNPTDATKPAAQATDKSTHAGAGGEPSAAKSAGATFSLPPLAAGYSRLKAATITDIEPGADVTFCQYVLPPVDRDMDILAVHGGQSQYGHHVVAFSYTGTGNEELNKSSACGATEFTAGDPSTPSSSNGHAMGQGGFLGSAATDVPEGVAFRLKQGDGVMLNIHYINVGDVAIDGESYLDMKLEPADPQRKIASLFTSVNIGFNLDPHAHVDSSMDCVVKSDLQFLLMANHMHEYGVSAATEVRRAGSEAVELLHEDPTWAPEMQFNPVFARWTAATPFVLHAGDTLRTRCSWNNTTSASIAFPREMCISAGFVLTSGDKPVAPGTCVSSSWIPAP